MDHKDQFEFYKELYFRENERRKEVLDSLNIPIAVITALSSVAYFLITSFDYQVGDIQSYIFILLISLTAICLLFAIFFLIKAFGNFEKGYEYSGLPYPIELNNWHKSLEDYYDKYENDKELAKKHFKDFLEENFIKHAEHNMYVNDEKYKFIYRSKQFLVISLCLILATLIPFGYNYFNKVEKTQKIELVKNNYLDNTEYKIINEKLNRIIDSLSHKKYE